MGRFVDYIYNHFCDKKISKTELKRVICPVIAKSITCYHNAYEIL